ncbi:unnamed protein product [Bursaphelenchus xylophilus]|uniref:(pine wood nematode) hypothetical protein n=1 Tax=Bursaphelenchus xylophilus TaxID=6326 RepID=A0A1I7RJI5_BURXY|nr:unnamed protein product [Bursaphelenchus xylophilus]CAG9128904.1 unnamed protein product [Bursaphelenchus xylophilus]
MYGFIGDDTLATFPVFLRDWLNNFNSPLKAQIEVIDRGLVTRNMLSTFNKLLSEQNRISEVQLNADYEGYQHHVMSYNVVLRRTTVCYSTRNNAALEIAKRAVRLCTELQLRHSEIVPEGPSVVRFQMSHLHIFDTRQTPEVSPYVSFGKTIPTEIGIVFSSLGNHPCSALKKWSPQMIMVDETTMANHEGFINMMMQVNCTAQVNQSGNNALPKRMMLFGDPFQMKWRFPEPSYVNEDLVHTTGTNFAATALSLARIIAATVQENGMMIPPSDIAIITPYRMQETTLHSMHQQHFNDLRELGIYNIDGTPSLEFEVVILDLTRTLPGGFMAGKIHGYPSHDDFDRFVVGITRPRRALIVLGGDDVNRPDFNPNHNAIDYLYLHTMELYKNETSITSTTRRRTMTS